MSDYIPADDDGLRAWIVNFSSKLATYGAAVGITAPQQSQLTSLGGSATGSIDNLAVKKTDYESALVNRTELRDDFLAVLRPIVRSVKTNVNYTETIGEALGVVAHNPPVDPTTIRPVIKLTTHINCVRVRIQRKGAESVNVYARVLGQLEWTFLARANRAVFDDLRPLANPGVAEVREYMVNGVIGDSQVGVPSDAKTVVFAGELAA